MLASRGETSAIRVAVEVETVQVDQAAQRREVDDAVAGCDKGRESRQALKRRQVGDPVGSDVEVRQRGHPGQRGQVFDSIGGGMQPPHVGQSGQWSQIGDQFTDTSSCCSFAMRESGDRSSI